MAAAMMNMHQSTVSRQLDKLEYALGFKIVVRINNRLELTDAGRRLLPYAQSLEQSFNEFAAEVSQINDKSPDRVVLYGPEGVTTHWVIPHYASDKANLGVELRVIHSFDQPEFGASDVDISLQYAPARSSSCMQVLLGHLHMKPYASRSFISQYGTPACAKDFLDTSLVAQLGPFDSPDFWFDAFQGKELDDLKEKIELYTNSGTSQYSAILSGQYIGALPTYASSVSADIVPIEIDQKQTIPIYAVFEHSKRRQRGISTVVQWLEKLFCSHTSRYFCRC